jgi:hypothetical protein
MQHLRKQNETARGRRIIATTTRRVKAALANRRYRVPPALIRVDTPNARQPRSQESGVN